MLVELKSPEHYKLKKIYKALKLGKTREKIIIKVGDIEIEKQNFHQYKRPISIKCILIKYW